MDDPIVICRGFAPELAYEAAGLYDEAFGPKLSIAIPDTAARRDILAKGMNPEFCFAAFRSGVMVGIAGFKTPKGSLTGSISLTLLLQRLGVFRSLRALMVLLLFRRSSPPNQLLMDGIGVSSSARGGGIGSRLLHSLLAYAKQEGFATVRLDVIETNPAVRRLYDRIGFIETRTERFPYLKWLLGFGAASCMVYGLVAMNSAEDAPASFPKAITSPESPATEHGNRDR
jgi:ribosomal protein S18 acetylase RimI-like enzyme